MLQRIGAATSSVNGPCGSNAPGCDLRSADRCAELPDLDEPAEVVYSPECSAREFGSARSLRIEGVERVVVTARLKPGSEDAAADIVRSGPPYDPGEIGLIRHGVYLGGSEVVFVFEGPNLEQELLDLLNDRTASAAFAVWGPLLEGSPLIAHELFYWEAPGEPSA